MSTWFRNAIKENGVFMLCLIVIVLLRVFVYGNVRVDGVSMYPTLHNGDLLILNKIAYRSKLPQYGDIVVFSYHQDPSQKFVKRVIGRPGDEINIDEDANVYVNGVLRLENYIREPMHPRQGDVLFPFVLGKDEFFCMGDNRNESMDSRYSNVGNIKLSEISGKAAFRFYPLNRISFIQHD